MESPTQIVHRIAKTEPRKKPMKTYQVATLSAAGHATEVTVDQVDPKGWMFFGAGLVNGASY